MTPKQKEAFRREVLEEAAKMIDVMETASFDSYVKSWGRNRAAAIRRFNQDNPDVSNQAMADHFGVNPGRVSEALAGKWS